MYGIFIILALASTDVSCVCRLFLPHGGAFLAWPSCIKGDQRARKPRHWRHRLQLHRLRDSFTYGL